MSLSRAARKAVTVVVRCELNDIKPNKEITLDNTDNERYETLWTLKRCGTCGNKHDRLILAMFINSTIADNISKCSNIFSILDCQQKK